MVHAIWFEFDHRLRAVHRHDSGLQITRGIGRLSTPSSFEQHRRQSIVETDPRYRMQAFTDFGATIG